VALKRAGCGRQEGLTEIAGLDIDGRVKNGVGHCRNEGLDIDGLDIDGLDNVGRIWAVDCNLHKITIQRFYQFTGTHNSFESVLCLKTYEIHIDQQKLRTYSEY